MLTAITHFVGTHEFVTCVKIFFIVFEAVIKAKMKKKEMKEGGETEGDSYASPFFFSSYSLSIWGRDTIL